MNIIMVLLAYLVGSIPMGYIWVRLFTGKDVREISSGKTSSTNAMRAGGVWVGLLTAVSDLLKGMLAVMLAQRWFPNDLWVHVFAGVFSVLGHNWSIFLIKRDSKGRFALVGGAGTAPNIGAAVAFWPPIILIAIPLILIFEFIIGYASLGSLTMALVIPIVFYLRYVLLGAPLQYTMYGMITAILVIFALRSNFKRLISGTESRVGIFKKTAK